MESQSRNISALGRALDTQWHTYNKTAPSGGFVLATLLRLIEKKGGWGVRISLLAARILLAQKFAAALAGICGLPRESQRPL